MLPGDATSASADAETGVDAPSGVVLRCPACLSVRESADGPCPVCGAPPPAPPVPPSGWVGGERLGWAVVLVLAAAAGTGVGWAVASPHETPRRVVLQTQTVTGTLSVAVTPPSSAPTLPVGTATDLTGSTLGTVPTETTPTFPTDTAGTTPTGTPTDTTPTDTTSDATADDWPSGRSGYAVILASKPVSGGRAALASTRSRAEAAGLDRLGVLTSGNYSTLDAGYIVLYEGPYDTAAAAKAAAASARANGLTDAYARQVTP